VARCAGGSCGPSGASRRFCHCYWLILCEAARRLGGNELIEVEIEDRLQRLPGGGVAQGLGQRFEPLRVLALEGDQFGHGVAPTLMAAAAIPGSSPGIRPAVADDRRASLARPIARLPFGAGKRLVALRLASSGHGSQFRHVTQLLRFRRPRRRPRRSASQKHKKEALRRAA
jgi:hypothetical protein